VTQPNAPEAQGPAPESAPAGSPEVTPSSTSEKGFPEGTPLAEMTPDQQLAYWKHHARRHEDTVKAFKGLTPQQIADIQAENESLKADKMTADEKALKAVRDEAKKQAKAEAEAEYLPQIRAAKVQNIASQIVSGDKLSAFMDLAGSSPQLLDENGQVSEEKVMGYLTAMYGTETPPGPNQPKWQNFGQYSPPPPRGVPGEAGKVEAQKRFGAKT
jgi:hypothetical protein